MASTWTAPQTWAYEQVVDEADTDADFTANIDFLHNPPSVCAYQAGAEITVATATSDVALTMDTDDWDNDTLHSLVSNTERLTATQTGHYIICGRVRISNVAGGYRRLSIKLNGSTIITRTSITKVSGTNDYLSLCVDYPLTATDYVVMELYQTSGNDVTVKPLFSMTLVGV